MLGNILLGSYIPGDKRLGVYVAEVQANISNSTVKCVFRPHGVFSSYHTKFRIPDLDIIINLIDDDERRTTKVSFGVYGSFDEFGTTAIIRSSFGAYAKFIAPEIVAKGPNRLAFRISNDISIDHPDNNAIAWSSIGEFDFTINESNVAGKMPIDWKGYVYAVEQLANSDMIYVYGDNGITLVRPSGNYFSPKILSRVGLKNKHSILNTGTSHYFINKKGVMYRLDADGKFNKLGYEEFFSTMNNLIMSYDTEEHLIYICDGSIGYIYSEDSQGLTQGPSNITGMYKQDGEFYIVGIGIPTSPDFDLLTDLFDMGTSNDKTIRSITLDCNDLNEIEVAIDYRDNPNTEFRTTPYVKFNPSGIANIPCFGKEFRFRFRGHITNSNFKMEKVTIDGVIHNYKPTSVN